VSPGTGIVNNAVVTGDSGLRDEDDTTVNIYEASINLDKTVSPKPYVLAGEYLYYTLVITNDGDVTLYGVHLVDDLEFVREHLYCHESHDGECYGCDDPGCHECDEPECWLQARLTITFCDPERDPITDLVVDHLRHGYYLLCPGVEDVHGNLNRIPGNSYLLPGQSATITFRVRVHENTLGGTLLPNTAHVRGSPHNAESEVRDTCNDSTIVKRNPSIDLDKTVYPGDYVLAGEELEYTLVVTNDGNVPLENVIVTDPLTLVSQHLAPNYQNAPLNITFNPHRAPIPDNLTVGDLIVGINIGDLQPGESATITFTVRVAADAPGGQVLHNTAYVRGVTVEGEEATGSDDDSVTVNRPSIDIDKSVLPQPYVVAGEDLDYTLVVTNDGNVPLYDVTVRDQLEQMHMYLDFDGSEVVTVVFSDDRPDMLSTLAQLMDPGINIGSLGVDQYATLTFTVTVDAETEAGTELPNTATVTGNTEEDGSGDDVGAEDNADVEVRDPSVYPNDPAVDITKTANPTLVFAGGNVVYTLVVTNTGNVPLENLVVTDNLPVQLTNPRNLILPTGATGQFTGNLLEVTLATLAPGERVTITFTATVATGTPANTEIVNTATVENYYVNDEDDATVTVRRRTPPPRPPGENGDIPTPPTPPTPPTDPQDPPVDIPDPDVPLAPTPPTDPQDPPVEIPDPDVPLAPYPDEPEDPTRRPIPQTGDEFSYGGLMTSGLGLLLSILALLMLLFARVPKLAVEARTPVNYVQRRSRFVFIESTGFTSRVDFVQRFEDAAKRRE
jgi:uncharacterized repeat protein (TIGR01451 family)